MQTEKTPLPVSIDPAALIEFFKHNSDFSAKELLVAAVLVQCASLEKGEANLQLAIWEFASLTGLSQAAVNRALKGLAERGLIGRSQEAKAKGQISVTTVTSPVFAMFGLQGGISAKGDVPRELLDLLVRESVEVANAIVSAWETHSLAALSVAGQFRGGARRWAQVEFLLHGRLEAGLIEEAAARQAADAATAAKEAGLSTVDLPSGEQIVFSQDKFRNAAKYKGNAMLGADMAFAAEVLSLVARKAPKALSPTAACSLAAEALYSRQKGFVHRKDFADAARIVASLMVKGTWSTPRGIENAWYQTTGAAMEVVHRVSVSASLN